MDRLPRLASARDRLTPPRSDPIPCVARPRYGIALGGLDVHHVRAPVRQERSGDRDEDPLGQLDDADSLEGLLATLGSLAMSSAQADGDRTTTGITRSVRDW